MARVSPAYAARASGEPNRASAPTSATSRPYTASWGRDPTCRGEDLLRTLERAAPVPLGGQKADQLLIANDNIRVVREDGSLLRELIVDAGRDYQPRVHSSSMS